ncbi:ZNF79 protein, partial [Bombycilla garrulus]|nr:ZNF79 protein [Bombycilla garrulus]
RTSHLYRHQRGHDADGRSFICAFCGRSFGNFPRFQRHQKTHGGVRPYKCWRCRKGFGDAAALVQHQGLHLGIPERPEESGRKIG